MVELPIIRVIFAKQKQKAPESVRTSGIALRRLWALESYNRPAGLWFQLASMVVALVKRDIGKDVPKFPRRTVGYNRWPHAGTA